MENSSVGVKRFARQISLPEVGLNGQQKLSRAKVLVIGCGALGSMVAMELAGAGVGLIGIADHDNIEVSNLQRQFFFHEADAGSPKVISLASSVKELNSGVEIIQYHEFISPKKADSIFPQYDFIIDATDNPESKRMTGEISSGLNKPCCIGGVKDFSGQVMTFLGSDSRFEEFFGVASSEGVLPCSLAGVFGPAAALCASLQASECLKYLLGIGDSLSGKIFTFDMLNNQFKVFSL